MVCCVPVKQYNMLSVGSIIAFYTPPVSVLWWFRRFCSSPCHVWKVTVSGTRNTRMEVFLSCLPNPDIAFCSSLKTCNFAWNFSHGHGLRTVTRFSQWNDAGKLEEVAWNASFGWRVVRFVRFGLDLGWRPPSPFMYPLNQQIWSI